MNSSSNLSIYHLDRPGYPVISRSLSYATAEQPQIFHCHRVTLQVLGIACLALQGIYAEPWKDVTSDKDIQLEQSGVSSLIKHLDNALPNVSVDRVVADTNHEITVKGGKYKWPATKDEIFWWS